MQKCASTLLDVLNLKSRHLFHLYKANMPPHVVLKEAEQYKLHNFYIIDNIGLNTTLIVILLLEYNINSAKTSGEDWGKS